MKAIRSGFWRDFWALFKPYWFSEEKITALLLLLAIVALTFGMVYMNVQINEWQNLFFNTLQDKNKPEFYRQILRFTMLAAIWICMAVYSPYLTQMLQIRWRRWLTDKYLKDWLADRTYYPMQLKGKQTDNPDQRVAEDLKIFVNQTLGLSIGLLNAVVTLVSFVGVLWVLSGPLSIPINGYEIVIPGYMVWVAIVYAALGNWLANRIGKPLIGLNFNQQRYEADFRYSLVRFRENMEGVALYRGEEDEMRGFNGRFKSIFSNWWAIMKRQKQLTWFTRRLRPGGRDLPVRGRGAALLFRCDPAGRVDADGERVRLRARVVVLVHQRLPQFCGMEGDGGPPHRLPQFDRGRQAGPAAEFRRRTPGRA